MVGCVGAEEDGCEVGIFFGRGLEEVGLAEELWEGDGWLERCAVGRRRILTLSKVCLRRRLNNSCSKDSIYCFVFTCLLILSEICVLTFCEIMGEGRDEGAGPMEYMS
jgi:hypothetical protein